MGGEAIIAGGWQRNNQQDYWAVLDRRSLYLLERSNDTKKKLTDDKGCILINATCYKIFVWQIPHRYSVSIPDSGNRVRLLLCAAYVYLTLDSQVGRVSNAGSRMSTDWMTPPRSLPPYNPRTSHTQPTHPQFQPPDTYLPGEHSCRAMTLHQLQFPEILQNK